MAVEIMGPGHVKDYDMWPCTLIGTLASSKDQDEMLQIHNFRPPDKSV